MSCEIIVNLIVNRFLSRNVSSTVPSLLLQIPILARSLTDFLLIYATARGSTASWLRTPGIPVVPVVLRERSLREVTSAVITVRRSSTISKLLPVPLFYRRRGRRPRDFSQLVPIFPINLPGPSTDILRASKRLFTLFAARRACPRDRSGSCNYPIRAPRGQSV